MEQMPITVVVKELVEVLGSRSVAVIAGVTKTSRVRAWIDGNEVPVCETRLCYALDAVRVLLEEGPVVARWWFAGTNGYFKGRAPALVLRDGPDEVGIDDVAAARIFITQ